MAGQQLTTHGNYSDPTSFFSSSSTSSRSTVLKEQQNSKCFIAPVFQVSSSDLVVHPDSGIDVPTHSLLCVQSADGVKARAAAVPEHSRLLCVVRACRAFFSVAVHVTPPTHTFQAPGTLPRPAVRSSCAPPPPSSCLEARWRAPWRLGWLS